MKMKDVILLFLLEENEENAPHSKDSVDTVASLDNRYMIPSIALGDNYTSRRMMEHLLL
jgi:hypothetical protein